ncbi:Twitching mobility protein [Methylorubrum aminovorans]|uniref:Twitching mobility protein n=1 Tax=Methylorubrum aminovorans TaxID=269069 RepID=A0ABQ4ULV2_9HYPH|nr:ATPase, T2SS/T4P/T4SS family [Methylorubrum aminovorans]GJE67671.1 Twitching mobility protein [Methylorubrum aminovorans]GMA79977.1 Dot/Icm secretion system ATPase DotB [Methylorubrum aminovorans]
MQWTGKTRYPEQEIVVHGRDEVTRLFLHAVAIGASDVIFQSGRPVLAAIHGDLFALTRVWLQPSTMARIATDLSSTDSIMSKLFAAQDFDRAVTIEDRTGSGRDAEPIRHRFRINVTAGYYEGDTGVQIVCRHIPAEPPTVATLGVDDDVVAQSTPAQGAVIVAGETGSGKTTTLAALIRRILEEETPIHGNILTYEAPIEFVFETVPSASCTIMQHEIGLHLPSFAAGVRNSLRRKPGLLLVGELRDMQTVMASVEAAQTGHPIYTTTHANDVAHILRRLTLLFPADLQVQAFHDVLGSSHMLVSQLLVPRVGGGRVCLREWQVLTGSVRREVARAGMAESVDTLRTIIGRGEQGRSMKVTVAMALEQGVIDIATARRVLERYGYGDARLAA